MHGMRRHELPVLQVPRCGAGGNHREPFATFLFSENHLLSGPPLAYLPK